MGFAELSYSLFRGVAKKYSSLFKPLEGDLRRAQLPYSLAEYFSMFLFSVLMITCMLSPLLFIILFFTFNHALIAGVGTFLLTILANFGTFAGFYFYPMQKAEARKRKIENAIHFAAIYMSTIAGTGAPAHVMFKVLGDFEEFGEIADTAKRISRDIEVFGMDVVDAISRAADRAPSERLKELLWGMRSTITTGGDLKAYLAEKAKGFTQDYRRKLEEYVRTLSILMEMYITVVIVGSIFTLVLTTIMTLIAGYMEQLRLIQIIVIAIGLPFISAIYILLLKTISPVEI